MSISAQSIPNPESTLTTTPPQPGTFDERWAAWQAKGAGHERAVRRKMTIVAAVVTVVAGILYALVGR